MDSHEARPETLAQLLRRVMDEHPDLTQTELARRVGVSISAINTWRSGARGSGRGPAEKNLRALAEALRTYGVTEAELTAAADRKVPGPLDPNGEQRVLELYRQLSAAEQRFIERQMQGLATEDRTP